MPEDRVYGSLNETGKWKPKLKLNTRAVTKRWEIDMNPISIAINHRYRIVQLEALWQTHNLCQHMHTKARGNHFVSSTHPNWQNVLNAALIYGNGASQSRSLLRHQYSRFLQASSRHPTVTSVPSASSSYPPAAPYLSSLAISHNAAVNYAAKWTTGILGTICALELNDAGNAQLCVRTVICPAFISSAGLPNWTMAC